MAVKCSAVITRVGTPSRFVSIARASLFHQREKFDGPTFDHDVFARCVTIHLGLPPHHAVPGLERFALCAYIVEAS
jgi:hypothetical protein